MMMTVEKNFKMTSTRNFRLDFLPSVDSKKKPRLLADKQREEVPVQPAQQTSKTIEQTLRLVDENVQKSQLDRSAQKKHEEVSFETARRASITIGSTERSKSLFNSKNKHRDRVLVVNSDQTKRRASLPLGFPTSKINLPAHPSSRVGLSRKSTTIKSLHPNLNPRVDSNENLS